MQGLSILWSLLALQVLVALALLLGLLLPEVSRNSKEEKQVIVSSFKVLRLDRFATCFKTLLNFKTVGGKKWKKCMCKKSTKKCAKSVQKIVWMIQFIQSTKMIFSRFDNRKHLIFLYTQETVVSSHKCTKTIWCIF